MTYSSDVYSMLECQYKSSTCMSVPERPAGTCMLKSIHYKYPFKHVCMHMHVYNVRMSISKKLPYMCMHAYMHVIVIIILCACIQYIKNSVLLCISFELVHVDTRKLPFTCAASRSTGT